MLTLCFQVKSKLLVSFRSKQVKVSVPEFIAEAEQQLLGAALRQWHSSAEGVVASSILEVRVAEQRLLHAVYRCTPHVHILHQLSTYCAFSLFIDVVDPLLQAGAACKLRWQCHAGIA